MPPGTISAVTVSISGQPATAEASVCPACGARTVTEAAQPPWCERCGWGVGTYVAPPDAGFFSRKAGALAYRIAFSVTMSEFRTVRAAGTAGLAWAGPRLLVIALSLGLYALTAAIAVAGGWLTAFRFPNLSIVPGLLLIAIAIYLVPRLGRVHRSEEVLSAADAPHLHELIRRVAAEIGVPRPHLVVINHEFNASAAAVGLRRRRVLRLGLTLWGALESQQRVALLSHELGHFANGDVRRALLTQPAITTLGRLADLFLPSAHSGYVVDGESLLAVIATRAANLIGRVIAVVLGAVDFAVLAVALRDNQRCEYFADLRSARIAGTKATVDLLDLLASGQGALTVIQASARTGETHEGWQRAVGELRQRQQPRLARTRQLSIRRQTSLHASHPPAGLRAALVESAGWQDPLLTLTPTDSQRIDNELSTHYARCRRTIVMG